MSVEDAAYQPGGRDRPIGLLLVADSLHVGGAERHIVSLASALAQQGHNVTLACSVEGALAPLAEGAGVLVQPLLRHLAKRRLSPSFALSLRRLLCHSQFDLVHAHMYASTLASAIATLGTNMPLVITEHSQATWRSHYARQCSQWAYHRARHIIAVSKEIQRRLIRHDGVAFDRVSVIMNALPPSTNMHRCTRQDLPATLDDGPLVGVAARLQVEKGVKFFLESAAYILQYLPHTHFLVIGDGPLRQELQAYADRLAVQHRVHFLGFQLDARALIGLLDVLVVPSLSEGTPLVTLEAMDAGVPVVASAVGGMIEQIRDRCEGLLVPSGDSRALAEAVLHLLQNPSFAQKLGESGRARVSSHFRFAEMVQETEAVYRTALSGHMRSDIERRVFDDPLAEARR
jgi:glycosyltransferase involved in cell wall biosynthesis